MNIKGKLIEKFDTQEISNSFRKREFVVEFAENPQYPEIIKFELTQTNCDQLNDFEIGDEVSVTFNLKGRKWTDPEGKVKYFTSLQAWRLEKENGDRPAKADPEWMKENFSEDDDLPF